MIKLQADNHIQLITELDYLFIVIGMMSKDKTLNFPFDLTIDLKKEFKDKEEKKDNFSQN